MTSTYEPQGPSDPGWVSRVCVAWALDDAPCPTELLPVLFAIARRCNNDGTGSYQSKPTLMEKTGKSRDQVDADVKKLLALGLIRRGDQTILENSKIPAGQRPVVYDVALEMRGPKPTKAGRNKEGKNKDGKGRAKPSDTPGTDTTPGMDTGGGTDTPGTPGMGTSPTPGMDTPQTSPSKNPLNNPSSLSARTSVTAAREDADNRERDESTSSKDPNLTWHQRLVIDANCPPHLAAVVSDRLRERYPDRGPAWWRKVHSGGDLAEIVKDLLDTLFVCPDCGGTGKTTTHDHYDQPIPTDCPACQPLTGDRITAFKAQLPGHPECPHDEEGGDIPMPGTGWMACPLCRKASGYMSPEERNRQRRSSERERADNGVPAGYARRPNGSLLLVNSHDPNIDWDATL